MILVLAATLAIVVQDHAVLRAAAGSSATALAALSQGDALEVRGQAPGYLRVYDYRRERAGYLKNEAARQLELSEKSAPELLTVLRFLRDTAGYEALGISYGAAYLKSAPAASLTAEPFDAIGHLAERLADQASSIGHIGDIAARLEAVQQLGIRMHSFERNNRVQVCYDGELFRRVLAQTNASGEQRAQAALGLTRPDCIDPDLSPATRASLDEARRELLQGIDDKQTSAMTSSRIHARRAGVFASLAFEQARRGEQPSAAGEQAVAELSAVHADELGEDRRGEYLDALLHVGAIRWAQQTAPTSVGAFTLSTVAGEPGQTCVSVRATHSGPQAALARRCTYGIVWPASAHAIAQVPALVLTVQPMDGWLELWVFHARSGVWRVDVLSPGVEQPELGYVEYAGFAAGSRRLLIVREVKERGRFHRHFQELRLDDLGLVHEASTPDQLPDFRRCQDAAWRRGTFALH